MDPLQDNLARNFDAFISALAQKQAERARPGPRALRVPHRDHDVVHLRGMRANNSATCDAGTCTVIAERDHTDQ